MKITNFIVKKGIKVDSVKGCGFGKAEVTFRDIVQANRCLELDKNSENPLVKFVILNRIRKCKGIIKDWDNDMPLDELASAIENSKNILQLERMKKRSFSAKDRRTTITYSHLVLVTMEGGSVPEFLSMYNGVTRINIRPFVEPVIQCFSCLRFGHVKDKCGRFKVCNVCGKAFHSDCNDRARCINCGGNHSAMDKGCLIFQENCELKRIMAVKNISAYEAIKVMSKENSSYCEDRVRKFPKDRGRRGRVLG